MNAADIIAAHMIQRSHEGLACGHRIGKADAEAILQKLSSAGFTPARPAGDVEVGWQPIQTAPKDGTAVLLFDPNTESGGGVFEGRYDEGEWSDFADAFTRHPTLWMSLDDLKRSALASRRDQSSSAETKA